MRLKDKVILITGSTTGVGEGMARMFAAEGALSFVHGTREPAAKQLVADIQEKGGRAEYVIGSLEDASVPAKLIARVVEQCGRIDGIVNNAAAIVRSNLATTDLGTWERVMAVNLRAPYLLIQAALPHFRRQGGGRVLNIGSINGYCGEANQFVYSISKGGLMTLTRNLADAHGPEGIRVNQFNLGWVLTPNEYALKISEGLPEGWPSQVPKTYAPSGKLMSPADIAYAAVYFLSDEASLINGSVLDLEQYPMIGRNPVKESL
jgi:NAD(P)-dependent dehydrogenase (short-subunit alcohol dehydrogenase family)